MQHDESGEARRGLLLPSDDSTEEEEEEEEEHLEGERDEEGFETEQLIVHQANPKGGCMDWLGLRGNNAFHPFPYL